MRYTIPELEGLAEAISKINSQAENSAEQDEAPLTGKEAVAALQAQGLL